MEKPRIYLDTNMILDVFINQAKTVRGKELPLPHKYQFMLDHLDTFHFITSVLTMAEVARDLLNAYHCTKEQIELDIIRLIRENRLYEKTLTYIEMQQMATSSPSSSPP